MSGLNGWIILDKPLGLGSTQAVAAVKRNAREAGFNMKLKGGIKVGHGGTLDPLATGILPIALGEATKLTGRMLDADKIYEFTVAFGQETDTLDLEGKVIANLQDASSGNYSPITTAREYGDWLYLGSLKATHMARLPLADALK